jgi:sec-independent protein translocase protein TatA
MPFNIGPFELLIVLILALLVLGPGKLPEVGSALGRTIREFRKASSDAEDSLRVEPAASSAAAARPVTPSASSPAADAPVAEAPADTTEDSAKS